MDIVAMLKIEESSLENQIFAVRRAIGALEGNVARNTTRSIGTRRKSTMSAAGRKAIGRASRLRWKLWRAKKMEGAKKANVLKMKKKAA